MIKAFLADNYVVPNPTTSTKKLSKLTQAPDIEDRVDKVFTYAGSDYLQKLIDDVANTKLAFQEQMKDQIPTLSKDGKLVQA